MGAGTETGARGLDGSLEDCEPFSATAIGLTGTGAGRKSSDGAGGGGGAGVSSTVECLPVVQGGMERNSSNVSTRGLQHFHPKIVEVR